MQRRELFQIFGAGLLAAAPAKVLSDTEYQTLKRMLDITLPPDGAVAAAYLDAMLFHGTESMRATWRKGLAGMERISSMSDADATAWLTELDKTDPFFAAFKVAAVQAYYVSEAGRKSLGYHGDTAVHHFAGCTHPDHQS